eukprot:403360706
MICQLKEKKLTPESSPTLHHNPYYQQSNACFTQPPPIKIHNEELFEKLILKDFNAPDYSKHNHHSLIPPVTTLGIQLKRRYTLVNLLAIPYLFFTIAIVSSFINTQMIFILRDENYFAVPQNQIGTVSSDIMFYMQLTSISLSLFIGYVFDIFGRKIPIFTSLLMCGCLMILIPQVAPVVYPSLIVVRIAIGVMTIAPNCHPLVSDYVSKSYRGRVTGYQSYGQIMGEFFTYAVLFSIQLSSFDVSYTVVGLLIISLSTFSLLMIKEHKEPKNSNNVEAISTARRDCCDDCLEGKPGILPRILCLTNVLRQECRNNIVLPISFFGVFIIKQSAILYNTFLILKITSYVDTGILASDQQARDIVQVIKIIQVFASLILIVFAGHYSDKLKYTYTIPLAFILKSCAITLLVFLDNPHSYLFKFSCVAIQSLSLIQNILIDGLFSKNLKKEIRGTLNGVYFTFGSLGMLAFAKIGGYLYDQVSQDMPFILSAGLNASYGLIILLLYIFNVIKH